MNTTQTALIASLLLFAPACVQPQETEPEQEPGSTSQEITEAVVVSSTTAFQMMGLMKTDATPCGAEAQGDGGALHCKLQATVCGDGPCALDGGSEEPLKAQVQHELLSSFQISDSQASCAQYQWGSVSSGSLTLTATFTQCVLPNSDVLDGSLSLTVAINPFTVAITMGNLTLGDDVFDGTSQLSIVNGTGGAVTSANVDMLASIDGGTFVADFDQFSFVGGAAGSSLSGKLGLVTSNVTADVDANSVNWAAGDCHPSSGNIHYLEGYTDVMVTFLPSTPSTGMVEVKIAQLPPMQQQLLQPCGS